MDLWEQLQDRARITSADDNLVGSMSYTEVKDCTSGAIGSEDEGSIFDVTIQGYERLTKRAESLIIQSIKYTFPNSFRAYLTKPEWTTIGDDTSSKSLGDCAADAKYSETPG